MSQTENQVYLTIDAEYEKKKKKLHPAPKNLEEETQSKKKKQSSSKIPLVEHHENLEEEIFTDDRRREEKFSPKSSFKSLSRSKTHNRNQSHMFNNFKSFDFARKEKKQTRQKDNKIYSNISNPSHYFKSQIKKVAYTNVCQEGEKLAENGDLKYDDESDFSFRVVNVRETEEQDTFESLKITKKGLPEEKINIVEVIEQGQSEEQSEEEIEQDLTEEPNEEEKTDVNTSLRREMTEENLIMEKRIAKKNKIERKMNQLLAQKIKIEKRKKNEKPKRKGKKTKFTYKTIKTSLKSILKKPKETLPIIKSLVSRINKIMKVTSWFLRYLVLRPGNIFSYNEIDALFIHKLSKCVFSGDGRGPKDKTDVKQKLQKIFNDEFSKLLSEEEKSLKFSNLGNTLTYATEMLHTNYVNLIRENFVSYLVRFINSIVEKNDQMSEEEKKKIDEDRRNLKNDLIYNGDSCNEEKYQNFKATFAKSLLPLPIEGNVYDELETNPMKFLKHMIWINNFLEQNESRLFNVSPLCSSLILSHVKIDTKSLIELLEQQGKSELLDKVNSNKEIIWEKHFHLEHRSRKGLLTFPKKSTDERRRRHNFQIKKFEKRGYKFHYIFDTDGEGASILYAKSGPNIEILEPEFKWADELSHNDKIRFQSSILVGCDPGKTNILNISKRETNGRITQFNYSAKTRSWLTYSYTSRKRMELMKKKNPRIKKIEDYLTQYNSKTSNFENFQDYVREHSKYAKELENFYSRRIFGFMKLRRFKFKKKADEKLVKDIKTKFVGNSNKELTIGFGNWQERKAMKGTASQPNIYLKRLFKRHFNVVLVEESRTTKVCNICLKEETNQIDKRDGRLIRGLLTCKKCNETRFAQIIPKMIQDFQAVGQTSPALLDAYKNYISSRWKIRINRDLNGSLNILEILKGHLYHNQRPEIFKFKR
jgi:hypothetical protein